MKQSKLISQNSFTFPPRYLQIAKCVLDKGNEIFRTQEITNQLPPINNVPIKSEDVLRILNAFVEELKYLLPCEKKGKFKQFRLNQENTEDYRILKLIVEIYEQNKADNVWIIINNYDSFQKIYREHEYLGYHRSKEITCKRVTFKISNPVICSVTLSANFLIEIKPRSQQVALSPAPTQEASPGPSPSNSLAPSPQFFSKSPVPTIIRFPELVLPPAPQLSPTLSSTNIRKRKPPSQQVASSPFSSLAPSLQFFSKSPVPTIIEFPELVLPPAPQQSSHRPLSPQSSVFMQEPSSLPAQNIVGLPNSFKSNALNITNKRRKTSRQAQTAPVGSSTSNASGSATQTASESAFSYFQRAEYRFTCSKNDSLLLLTYLKTESEASKSGWSMQKISFSIMQYIQQRKLVCALKIEYIINYLINNEYLDTVELEGGEKGYKLSATALAFINQSISQNDFDEESSSNTNENNFQM